MVNKCDHLLLDILMIAICATIASADDGDMAYLPKAKRHGLKQWLALPNGIPSHALSNGYLKTSMPTSSAVFHELVQTVV